MSLSAECSSSLYPRLLWGVRATQPVWAGEWNSHPGQLRCSCHLSPGDQIGPSGLFPALPFPHFCSGLVLRSMCHLTPIFRNILGPKSVLEGVAEELLRFHFLSREHLHFFLSLSLFSYPSSAKLLWWVEYPPNTHFKTSTSKSSEPVTMFPYMAQGTLQMWLN